MSRSSLHRRQGKVRARLERKFREIQTRCTTCQAFGRSTIITANTDAVMRARLLEHYQQAHPQILASGGIPVVGKPNLS